MLAVDPTNGTTVPEPNEHCEFCEFFDICTRKWRDKDSLVYVAGIRKLEQSMLRNAGVRNLADLSEYRGSIERVRPERLVRLVDQATLQALARLSEEGDPPPFRMIEATDDGLWGHGSSSCPSPIRATCSSISRAIRSGGPTRDCSSFSVRCCGNPGSMALSRVVGA